MRGRRAITGRNLGRRHALHADSPVRYSLPIVLTADAAEQLRYDVSLDGFEEASGLYRHHSDGDLVVEAVVSASLPVRPLRRGLAGATVARSRTGRRRVDAEGVRPPPLPRRGRDRLGRGRDDIRASRRDRRRREEDDREEPHPPRGGTARPPDASAGAGNVPSLARPTPAKGRADVRGRVRGRVRSHLGHRWPGRIDQTHIEPLRNLAHHFGLLARGRGDRDRYRNTQTRRVRARRVNGRKRKPTRLSGHAQPPAGSGTAPAPSDDWRATNLARLTT